MTEQFDFETMGGGKKIVYVRPVETRELPDDIRSELGERKMIYALHTTDGERLALVRDRALAFLLARQNDMEPVTVH